ncbi:MAG: 50S ribosomal protein L14e [Candidatus Micrarchaeia archaeon]
MALIEIGRVCVKKYGRDAGSRGIITKAIDKNFVNIITADRLKERRCNIKHLELLNSKVDLKDKEAVAKALELQPKEAEKLKI